MKKTCVICGKVFESKIHNRSVCYDDHYHPCPICGKDVLCNDPKRQDCTCSRKCGQQKGNISRQKSNLIKYGVDNVSKIPEVRSKISDKLSEIHPKQPTNYKVCEVCGNKFVLTWPYTQHTCSPKCRGEYRRRTGIARSVYTKASQTNLDRYGVENQGQRPEIHAQMENTMELRYGVRYARYLPEIEDKVKTTCMERYGVPYYIQTEDANRANVYRISSLNKKFQQLCEHVGLKDVSLEKYIEGKFFDLCIGDVVIEINPTYTHNSYGNHWNKTGLPYHYHLDKTRLASEHGYRCIHVWDWDDWNSVIELLKPVNSIGARRCDIQKIDKQTANIFTQTYHMNRKCNGQILNYGLYYHGELVEVMTFGKPRYNSNYDYELLRLCSKHGIQVMGGASKLFSKFIEDNTDVSVISYCDLSKFSGRVYEKMGMNLLRYTSPNKIWSKGSKKITQNLLNQRGYDQLFHTDYGKGTSNEQLMIDNGWLPVYDCGQAVYIYTPSDADSV